MNQRQAIVRIDGQPVGRLIESGRQIQFQYDAQWLTEKVALRVLVKQVAALDQASQLIDHCFLPDDQKQQYQRLIQQRTELIR